jgi:hypothetical protein
MIIDTLISMNLKVHLAIGLILNDFMTPEPDNL